MNRNYFIPYFDSTKSGSLLPTLRLGIRGQGVENRNIVAIVSTVRPCIVIPEKLAIFLAAKHLSSPPPGVPNPVEKIGKTPYKMPFVSITVWIHDELGRQIKWDTFAAVSRTNNKVYFGQAGAIRYFDPRFRERGIEVQPTEDFPGTVTKDVA